MYENLKMKEILEKLDQETADSLRQRWPETKYTAREIFRRMDVKTLTELYIKGLEINCACLAVLTAEALIGYDVNYRYNSYSNVPDTSVIRGVVVKKLQNAFDNHQITRGSNLTSVLGFTLLDKCHDYDYLLAKYGYELSRDLIFMGPEDWFKETVKNSRRIPPVAYRTPWTKALLA